MRAIFSAAVVTAEVVLCAFAVARVLWSACIGQ
jgi:hypothetical protein